MTNTDGWQLEALWRVLTLADYNTRVVVVGTSVLGLCSGLIGTFMLLRKRSLVADVVSHSTLPGVGLAFLVMVAYGGSGKWLPGLLLGALLSGLLGMAAVVFLARFTPVKEDAALGTVLSVFFGVGIAILGLVQRDPRGTAAGLESFVFGKTASMLASDAYAIAAVAVVCTALCALLSKELTLLCFDPEFAASRGYSVGLLDLSLMSMMVVSTVIGLQAVGLILVIALLIIPPAAARFWTDRFPTMALLAAGFGAVGAGLGALLSALAPKLPAGAVIVLTQAAFFTVSFLIGARRGLLKRRIEAWKLSRRTGDQHLLRTLFEEEEQRGLGSRIGFNALHRKRSWSAGRLRALCRRAQRLGWLESSSEGLALTQEGRTAAASEVRQHRLWELYLIHHTDLATSRVDRGADRVEHHLDQTLVEELEELLSEHHDGTTPPSPHPLGDSRSGKAGGESA